MQSLVSLLLTVLIYLPCIADSKAEIDRREMELMNRALQASDTNADSKLSLDEAKQFGNKISDLLLSVYPNIKPLDEKDKEHVRMIVEKTFKRFDTDGDGFLSFRGTLTQIAAASVYGKGRYKAIINFFHDQQGLPLPFFGRQALPRAETSVKDVLPGAPASAFVLRERTGNGTTITPAPVVSATTPLPDTPTSAPAPSHITAAPPSQSAWVATGGGGVWKLLGRSWHTR